MSYLMDYGIDQPPAPELSRAIRFYDAVVVPAANFTVRWISRTGICIGLFWLLAIAAGWLH